MKYKLFKALGLGLLLTAFSGLPAHAWSYTSDLFPNGTLDEGWQNVSLSKGNTWQHNGRSTVVVEEAELAKVGATGAADYQFNENADADAWLVSPEFELKANTTYTVGVWAKTQLPTYAEKFKVVVGTSSVASELKADNTELIKQENYKNSGDLEHFEATYTPTSDGTYYFGINCFSEADQTHLFVTHFTLSDGSAELPFDLVNANNFNKCTTKKIYGNYDWAWYPSGNCIRLEDYSLYAACSSYLTTPTFHFEPGVLYSIDLAISGGRANSYNGEIDILKGAGDDPAQFELLKKYDDFVYDMSAPTKEDIIYFTVDEPVDQAISFHGLACTYIFRAIISAAGTVNGPAAALDLTATPQGTTNVVDIAFTIPTKSLAGSDYQAGTMLGYKLFRGEDEITSGEAAIGTTINYTDNDAPEGDVTYTVVIYKDEDASPEKSASCWVGELKTILAETFPGAKMTYEWTIESSNSSYPWTVAAQSKNQPSAKPQDNDGGLAYFNSYSASSGATSRLISPVLSTATSKYPVLSFYFYHSINGSQADKIAVEVKKDNGEWIEIEGSTINRIGSTTGWEQYSFSILPYITESTTYQIAFKATSANGYDMAIDNILLENDITEYFKVMDVTITPVDNGYSVDWMDPATDEPLTYDIVRFVNGEESTSFTGVTTKPFVDEYTVESIASIYYTVTAHTSSASTEPASSPVFKAGFANLPLFESFANSEMSDLWDIEFTGSTYKWEVAPNHPSSPNVQPQDNDGGLLKFNAANASKNSTSTLITPPISVATSEAPVFSYWVYGVSSSAQLRVMISTDGGEWQTVEGSDFTLSKVPYDWTQYQYKLFSYIENAHTYRVAVEVTSDYGYSHVVIDNISIVNNKGFYLNPASVSVTPVEGGYNVDWDFNADMFDDVTYEITRYVNGEESEKFENVTEKPYFDAYEPASLEMIYYTVVVKSEDAVSDAIASAEFKAGSFELPVAESFAGAKLGAGWSTEIITGSADWTVTGSSVSHIYATPQDEDGGLIYFNCYSNRDSSARLVSPPLNTKSSTNPFVNFYLFHHSSGSDKLYIEVRKDGGDWVQLPDVQLTVQGSPTGWTEYSFPLINAIQGSLTYEVAFKVVSEYGYEMALDNIVIENKAEYDLAVSAIAGPAAVVIGNDAQYKFSVINKGGHNVAPEDYSVNIECDGLTIEPVELQDIAANASVEYTFTVPFTAHELTDQPYELTVTVDYDADEILENNTASTQTTVSAVDKKNASDIAAELTQSDESIVVSWNPAINMDGYEAVEINESFEDYENDTTDQIGGFKAVDASTATSTGSWYGYYETNFKVTSKANGSYAPTPTNGSKYLVVIGGNGMDKWLISPEINCFEAATLNFSMDIFLRQSNQLTYEVLYSTTDDELESFTGVIDSQTVTPNDQVWKTLRYDNIPSSAKYIAFRMTSTASNTGAFLDNFVITDEIDQVLGYHVYEEGVGRLNDEMLEPTVTSFEVPVDHEAAGAAPGETYSRAFTVTAVYGEGETAKSEPAQVELTVPQEAKDLYIYVTPDLTDWNVEAVKAVINEDGTYTFSNVTTSSAMTRAAKEEYYYFVFATQTEDGDIETVYASTQTSPLVMIYVYDTTEVGAVIGSIDGIQTFDTFDQAAPHAWRVGTDSCDIKVDLNEDGTVTLLKGLNTTTGVESVVVDSENAVYYNLNGVEMPAGAKLPAGVYLKVVGKTATKVIVK